MRHRIDRVTEQMGKGLTEVVRIAMKPLVCFGTGDPDRWRMPGFGPCRESGTDSIDLTEFACVGNAAYGIESHRRDLCDAKVRDQRA